MAKRSSASALRIGLLGAGAMGATHSSAYLNIPGTSVSAVWDADPRRAQKIASLHGAKVYERRENLLREVDAVDICLPTPFHLENIQAAASAKRAVICEKPLGRTLEQCDAAIAVCRSARVPLLVGHVVRFFPEYVMLRRIIQTGQIGTPAVLHLRRVVSAPGDAKSWYWNLDASGGCVLDTAIHDLDWLLWTLGRPARVYGLGFRDVEQLQDLALLTITWESGLIAHVECSWCHDRFSTSFEASGADGLVEYDLEDSAPLRLVRTRGAQAEGGGKVVPESPLAKSPYQIELEHFIGVIRGREQPLITPADAREAVELALAASSAAAERKVVELPKRARDAARAPARPAVRKRMPALSAAHPE